MSRFDYFVMFAEMRTGSNFLEANLNTLDGVQCLGEAFNPAFIGYPNATEVLGVTLDQRQRDPLSLIAAVRGTADKLSGFRFFNDHDPRVLEALLSDPRCAKIVLTRNPVDSYVSRKIAAATGQWKLTNAKNARSDVVGFDAAEFEEHLERLQAFQVQILRALQISGQTAFYVDYEDIQDLDVINGLAAFLDVPARLEALDRKLKKQNPEPIEDKVSNFAAMEGVLARLDRFNLSRTPNFEPRRGAALPQFHTAATSPLLYMTIKGGPEAAVIDWLTALDGAAPLGEFNHKSLRQWKTAHPGHRSFTVLRHPLARAHSVFCDRILATGPGTFGEIRQNLIRHFGMVLPGEGSDSEHAAAFSAFLGFLKANLSGQTALRTDASWASQAAILQGMANFVLPDHLLRESELQDGLDRLAMEMGFTDAPRLTPVSDSHAAQLARIVTPALQAKAREAYARDFMLFGFGDWAA